MAVHPVEAKLLGILARETADPVVSAGLFKVLGLSTRLARYLVRARKTRKLDTTRDTKSLDLYHRIIFLSREGLSITEDFIIPAAERPDSRVEVKIFAAKLRASFYHVFCLFHNNPPVTTLTPTQPTSPLSRNSAGSPLAVRQGNGQHPRRSTARSPTSGQQVKDSREAGKENSPQQQPPEANTQRTRQAALRDAIPSMTSEASYITNPYPSTVTPPPGLQPLPTIQQPASFLLPATNYVPTALGAFQRALTLANSYLPGSSPLRVSIALEFCAFLWDCMHDHEGCRRLARRAIQEVYRAEEGMDDDEFDDSAYLVGTLGKMMRRQEADETPRLGAASPPTAAAVGVDTSMLPMPQIVQQQQTMQGVLRPSNNPRPEVSQGTDNPRSTTPKTSPPSSPRNNRRGNGGKSPRGSSNGQKGDRARGGGRATTGSPSQSRRR